MFSFLTFLLATGIWFIGLMGIFAWKSGEEMLPGIGNAIWFLALLIFFCFFIRFFDLRDFADYSNRQYFEHKCFFGEKD